MGKGSTKKDVLEIVGHMQSPEFNKGYKTKLRLSSKKVDVALSQYHAREELKNRGKYKRSFKDKLNNLIEEKKREIEENHPNLLSVKIKGRMKKTGMTIFSCSTCNKGKLQKLYAKIKYFNGKGSIPVEQEEEKDLLYYCEKCGQIEDYDSFIKRNFHS